MKPLEVQRIRVRKGALDIEVAVALEALHVTQGQAERMLAMYPNLARHVCVNEREDGTFGAEIVGTELPHLLEHLIIELQAQLTRENEASAASGMRCTSSFTGHTSWLEELAVTAPQGFALMRVTVTFADDFVALQALKDACEIIEDSLISL